MPSEEKHGYKGCACKSFSIKTGLPLREVLCNLLIFNSSSSALNIAHFLQCNKVLSENILFMIFSMQDKILRLLHHSEKLHSYRNFSVQGCLYSIILTSLSTNLLSLQSPFISFSQNQISATVRLLFPVEHRR